MALPTRGQPDWDDELGNHIAGLEADLQSAKSNAEQAISNANEARNVAQSVRNSVLGGADVANAALINDNASATAQALSATYGAGKNADENVDGAKTFTSQKGLRTTTWFGLGAGVGSARNPFYVNTILDGLSMSDTLAAGGGDDYVGSQINVKFQGGFAGRKDTRTASIGSGSTNLTVTAALPARVAVGWTVVVPGAGAAGADLRVKVTAIAGDRLSATLASAAGATVSGVSAVFSLAADHNYLFGANDFFTTGSTAGAVTGIDHIYGRLSEVHVYTPGAALSNVRGEQAEAALEASAVGTTVDSMSSRFTRSVKQNVTYDTRTVTDAVISNNNSTRLLTSATAAFTGADVGKVVKGISIHPGTVIQSVTNSTTVVLSRAAMRNNTGVTVEIFTPNITNAYDHYIEGVQAPGVREHLALYVANGGRSRLGPTRLYGSAVDDVPLTLQAPLNPTGNLMEVYDVTLTNRVLAIGAGGGVGSSQGFTAYEGLGAQTTIGSMTGGFGGLRIGSGTDAELRRTASGVIESSAKFRWVAANATTTAPAGATRYFAIVGDDGTTYYLTGRAA